jgi:DNA-binding PucR family transcriptional regulator
MQKTFVDMINGIKLDLELIEHNISTLHWKIYDNYQVLIVKLDERDFTGGVVKYTSNFIRDIFMDSVLFELDNTLVVILHCTETKNIEDIISNKLLGFLSRRNCKASLSMRFTNITLVDSHYKSACIALAKGEALNPDKRIYNYEEYLICHIVEMCSQSTDVQTLCNPDALAMFHDDIKNNTQMLKSLYVYLLSGKSLSSASKILNIHRNTLVYRLSKISENYKIDLNNPNKRLHIIFSYMILHTLHPEKL